MTIDSTIKLCRLYRYFYKLHLKLWNPANLGSETLYLPRETNKSFPEPYFRLKGWRRHSFAGDSWITKRRGSLFQSILRVETNSANLVDSIISSRLENSPSSSSSTSVSTIRSILGFTYRRRNCECRRPCNCESSKENGNFPSKSEEKKCRQRALTGSKLSIEISIT